MSYVMKLSYKVYIFTIQIKIIPYLAIENVNIRKIRFIHKNELRNELEI